MNEQAGRIALLIPDLRGGGAERIAVTLVNAFAGQGYEVDLLLMNCSGELLSQVSPAVRIFDLRAPRIRNVLRPLLRYLRERRPQAIQISLWPLTIIGIVAARLSGVPVRVVVSDHMTLSQQYGRNPATLTSLKLTTRLLYPLAQGIVSVSIGSARDLARLAKLPEHRITVIYNPVPERKSMSSADVRSQWGTNGPRILSVGTLKRQKNHMLLITALARLTPALDASLVIAGDGELRQELQTQVKRLGLERRVTFAGYVENIGDYYSAANLFVLSSDYEGFAVVVGEALHAGLKIVSTDCPDGPSEILEGGRYGTLVPVGDAVALAAAIESTLQLPGAPETQKRRAADFTTQAAADEYLRLMGLKRPAANESSETVAEPEAKRRGR